MIWPHTILWGMMGYILLDMGLKEKLDRRAVRQSFGICSLAASAMGVVIIALSGQASLATVLPFHLCTVSGLIVPLTMCRKRYLLSFMYYLGMPGGIVALMVPSMLETDLPFALAAQFMSMHSIIVLSVLWIVCVEGDIVRPRGVISAFIAGNVLLLMAHCANVLTGGNYMYLAYAPPGTPLVLFGEPGSPLYILCLEACALAVMLPMAAAGFVSRRKAIRP